MGKPIFSPSLMCMDIANMLPQLAVLNAHCDMYHVDIMDGYFVKNITLSVDFVRAVRPYAQLPVDVHLMVTDPGQYVEGLVQAGADIITFHAEAAAVNAFTLIQDIHALGSKAGVCLCPATPVSAIQAYLGELDLVTVMTVDPGRAGRSFIPQMVEKVAALEDLRGRHGHRFLLQCDGAIGPANYGQLYAAGARAFVMGSTGLFTASDGLEENCIKMKADFVRATCAEVG